MPLKDRSAWAAARGGFTLLEVVVVMAVLAVLAALLVPAVQSARATALRLRCQNHERQIVLAMHAYVDLYEVLPPLGLSSGRQQCAPQTALTLLFPILIGSDNCQLEGGGVDQLPLLLCPADGTAVAFPTPMSYVVNSSPGDLSGSLANGPFRSRGGTRLAAIRDGLSQTAAMSERLAPWSGGTTESARQQPLRYLWIIDLDPLSDAAANNPGSPLALTEMAQLADQSVEDCWQGPRRFQPLNAPLTFLAWGRHVSESNNYTHWFHPNTPRCGGSVPISFALTSGGSAYSAHAGGVNVAFLDGHVQFVSENVDLRPWRAAGTQDGGERESLGSQE